MDTYYKIFLNKKDELTESLAKDFEKMFRKHPESIRAVFANPSSSRKNFSDINKEGF